MSRKRTDDSKQNIETFIIAYGTITFDIKWNYYIVSEMCPLDTDVRTYCTSNDAFMYSLQDIV